MQSTRPRVIVLTGGPCAGKTTLLTRLEQLKVIAGHELLFVPEAATILVSRGLVIGQNVVHFQTETMRLQLQLEREAIHRAQNLDHPCAIICDRGTLDGAGYCSALEFDAIAAKFKEKRATLAARYGLVVHLVSAAVEAPGAYTLDNNTARIENLEEAIAQEHRTLQAWATHPNRHIIGCPDSFEKKLDDAIECIAQFLQ